MILKQLKKVCLVKYQSLNWSQWKCFCFFSFFFGWWFVKKKHTHTHTHTHKHLKYDREISSAMEQEFKRHPGGYNPKGRWFKCPNGHLYTIGDCGYVSYVSFFLFFCFCFFFFFVFGVLWVICITNKDWFQHKHKTTYIK